jgi:hypothetical protein
MLENDKRHRTATLSALQSRAARKLVAPYTAPIAEYQRRLANIIWLLGSPYWAEPRARASLEEANAIDAEAEKLLLQLSTGMAKAPPEVAASVRVGEVLRSLRSIRGRVAALGFAGKPMGRPGFGRGALSLEAGSER